MKKFKKVFAVLLTLAMVLGMSMTAFADNITPATITVNGAGESAEFNYVKIIKANPEKATGWEIESAYKSAFTNVFGGTDEQTILQGMINITEGKDSGIENFDKKYADALNTVFGAIEKGSEGKTYNATSAGVYFIKIVETNVTYSPLTAYVSFGAYTNGVPTKLTVGPVNAKKEKNTVTKTHTDAENDNIVSLGDEVTFEIRTNIPYVEPGQTDTVYKIYDTITGAQYKELKNSTTTITMAGKAIPGIGANDIVQKDNKFSLDLSSLINDQNNANAGKEIVITYKALITDVDTVNNIASAGNDQNEELYGDKTQDDLFTGVIGIEKYDSSDNKALAGAKFKVYKKDGDEKILLAYDSNKTSGSNYVLSTSTPSGTDPHAILEVGADGKLTFKGLPQGTYIFEEVEAPEGYHIGENPNTEVTLTLAAGEKAEENLVNSDTKIPNSRLASLPSTGGIGTTIFTIGGCAIMIIAAALFFVSRRKAVK